MLQSRQASVYDVDSWLLTASDTVPTDKQFPQNCPLDEHLSGYLPSVIIYRNSATHLSTSDCFQRIKYSTHDAWIPFKFYTVTPRKNTLYSSVEGSFLWQWVIALRWRQIQKSKQPLTGYWVLEILYQSVGICWKKQVLKVIWYFLTYPNFLKNLAVLLVVH